MSKHEHKECEHAVEFCPHCDVVFCKRCEKEWGAGTTYTPFTTTTIFPNETTWGTSKESVSNGVLYAPSACSHGV